MMHMVQADDKHPPVRVRPELRIGKEHDGARILWRRWDALNSDTHEGNVREFSPQGDYVRLSLTTAANDRGEWYEVQATRLVAVLDPAKADAGRPEKKKEKEAEA